MLTRPFPIVLSLLAVVVLYLALVPGPIQAQGPLPDKFQYSIEYQSPPGHFRAAQDVAIAPNGDIYILDRADKRVQRFTADGVFLSAWGSHGSGEGQLSQPQGIAVGLDGTVYVADGGHRRLLRFSPDGRYLGVLPREFECYDDPYYVDCGPYDVAVGPVFIYASDPYSRSFFGPEVVLFSPQGAFVGRIWLEEDAEEPDHLAVAPDGSIYIKVTPYLGADNAIQHYSADFDFLGQWEIDVANVDYVSVEGLAVAPDGTVYITLYTSGGPLLYLRRYSASGQLLAEWRQPNGGSPFASLGDLTITQAGTLLVTTASGVLRLDGEARLLGEIGTADAMGRGPLARGLAFAPDGTLFSVSGSHVQRWSTHGELLAVWPVVGSDGRPFWEDGRPLWAIDISVAPDHSVYVVVDGYGVEGQGHQVLHFSATGTWLRQWGVWGGGAGQLRGPRGIAVGPDGTVYVADTINDRIQRFSATGQFLALTQGAGTTIHRPWDLKVAPDGTVFVASGQRFSADLQSLGRWLRSFVATGLDTGIDLAPDGTVYVTTSEPERVYRYSATGEVLGYWGTQGNGPGEFTSLEDVAIADDGRVFVGDPGNGRIHVFGTETSTTWRVQVYDNGWLGGTPVVITDTLAVTLDGLLSAPIPATGASVWFERGVSLPEGNALVALQARGGVRLWLGDDLIIDQWDGPTVNYQALVRVPGSYPYIRLEYRLLSESPQLQFSLTPTDPHRLFLPLLQQRELSD
jgi:tripartite motif-containing protein 71